MQGNTELIALTRDLAANKGGNPMPTLILVVLMVVVFYFLLIRPQRRRQQQQAQMQARIHPGQRVMTTAGLLATVAAVEDDALVLEIAPGVEARFVKQAIAQLIDDTSDDDDQEGEQDADETDEAVATDEAVQDEVEPKAGGKEPSAESAEADDVPQNKGTAGA